TGGVYSTSTSDVVNQVVNSDTAACGSFGTPAPTYGTGSHPVSVSVADFDKDGFVDLAITNQGSATISVLSGNGDGTFQAAVDHGTGFSLVSAVAGDFNGDGNPDLAVANNGDGNVTILLGDGTGAFTQPLGSPFGAGSGPFQ